MAPGKKILIGGWGGSSQLPAILKGLDKGLPGKGMWRTCRGRVDGTFTRFDEEMWLRATSSPEYYGYTPDWGRPDSLNRKRLQGLIAQLEKTKSRISDTRFKAKLELFNEYSDFRRFLSGSLPGREKH